MAWCGNVVAGRFARATDFVYTLTPDSKCLAREEETAVADAAPASRSSTLTRALCIVVLAGMAVAVAFAAWISVLNFSRIGV